MSFPVYLEFFGLRLDPHMVFESLAYLVGTRLYFWQRKRSPGPRLPFPITLAILVGCVFGALAGSKLLAWAEHPAHYWALRHMPLVALGGKTIVGGLLGGWAGVELVKRFFGVRHSTGDAFVWPLAVGTAIGRLGCFFTGLDDGTYGTATAWSWGVDFGDGIARHPTQVYESAFVLVLAAVLAVATRDRELPSGARFRLYFAGYFTFRFFVEMIKPRETPIFGLSAIQLASLAGVALSLASLRALRNRSPTAGVAHV